MIFTQYELGCLSLFSYLVGDEVTGRAVVIEGPPRTRSSPVPRFVGLRTPRWLYVEHAWGQRELYALRRDPAELRNLATVRAAAPRRRALALRLARLRSCAGRACR